MNAILARTRSWALVSKEERRRLSLRMIGIRNGRRAQANYRKRGVDPCAIARAVYAKQRADRKQREFEAKMLQG
jgi:hypothetical protein